jgi:hypothetical protein
MTTSQKSLFECDPKELDIELPSILQGALIGKLLLVNRETVSRFRGLVELGRNNPNQEKRVNLLSSAADRYEAMNILLEAELEKRG